jgi:hypothetical protein
MVGTRCCTSSLRPGSCQCGALRSPPLLVPPPPVLGLGNLEPECRNSACSDVPREVAKRRPPSRLAVEARRTPASRMVAARRLGAGRRRRCMNWRKEELGASSSRGRFISFFVSFATRGSAPRCCCCCWALRLGVSAGGAARRGEAIMRGPRNCGAKDIRCPWPSMADDAGPEPPCQRATYGSPPAPERQCCCTEASAPGKPAAAAAGMPAQDVPRGWT